MSRSRLLSLALGLILIPVNAACVAVAVGAGVGLLVSQELLDNETVRDRYRMDFEEVWVVVQDFMAEVSTETPEFSHETPRTARGVFQGAQVRIEVRAEDLNLTDVVILARAYGARSGSMSMEVSNRLRDRLEGVKR